MVRAPIACALLLLGCGSGNEDAAGADAAPPAREVEFDLAVEESGFSQPATFTVPADTRSVTVIAQGSAEALYALGELRAADGIDLVGLAVDSPAAAMRASYYDEQIGQMPGGLYARRLHRGYPAGRCGRAQPRNARPPGEGNLMEDGTTITADQAFALTRSALLRPN